ncbi:hypothetical protein lerEdw1_011144 [Lerista edwardsae]|nr:hypothetical protein lerEdw1_011144 [Lerista edwardsae]
MAAGRVAVVDEQGQLLSLRLRMRDHFKEPLCRRKSTGDVVEPEPWGCLPASSRLGSASLGQVLLRCPNPKQWPCLSLWLSVPAAFERHRNGAWGQHQCRGAVGADDIEPMRTSRVAPPKAGRLLALLAGRPSRSLSLVGHETSSAASSIVCE